MAVPSLRPRSTPEIVDAAFQLARRHFMPLLIVSAIVAIPSLVIGATNAWLLPAPNPDEPLGEDWERLPLSILGMCWTFIGYGAVTIAASDAYLGGDSDPGRSLRQALARALPLIGGNLVGYVVMLLPFVVIGVVAPLLLPQLAAGQGATAGGGTLVSALALIALSVAALVWMVINLARVTLVTPIAALERTGAIESWRRAGELSAGSKRRILGLVLIAGAVALGLVFGGFALLRTLIANETLASALSSVVAIPLWPVLGSLFVVLYYDLRIRKEAFDLEVMTQGLEAPVRQSPA